MPRDYKVFLHDVLEAIANVVEFLGPMTRDIGAVHHRRHRLDRAAHSIRPGDSHRAVARKPPRTTPGPTPRLDRRVWSAMNKPPSGLVPVEL